MHYYTCIEISDTICHQLSFINLTAECWSGSDDSKYDKDGKSEECVTFGMEKCNTKDELCAGQRSTNFIYYIDVPEHTKSKEEAKKEMEALKKAEEEKKKKAAAAKAKKAKKEKKSKCCQTFGI